MPYPANPMLPLRLASGDLFVAFPRRRGDGLLACMLAVPIRVVGTKLLEGNSCLCVDGVCIGGISGQNFTLVQRYKTLE